MGKPQFYPKIFDIDISVCMSCQICVDLAKSNEYYHSICPTNADGVDAKLAEAAAKKKPAPPAAPATVPPVRTA